MGEWYTPPGGRAAYLEGVNRVLVEQDGVTRSMAIELLARFLGAVDQGAALNGVTLLYGLDNGAGLPGAVLQTKIDGYIAAGVNPLSIGWRSIGTEEGAVVVLVPGSGAVGGVAATTGVTTLTGIGVSTGVGVGSFNGSAATTSAASLTGSGAGSAPSTPVASVTAGNTQNTIALASGGSGATSYDIWWGTTPGTRTNHLPGVTLPYVHTGRTNGTAYYYSIMAINASGYSESAEVSGTPIAAGFTDTFTGADASAPSTSNWTGLYQLNPAKMAAGSYFNIQGNTLKSHLQSTDGTLVRNLYYSAISLPVATGRYLEWTYASNLSNVSQTHLMVFMLYNGDDNAPEAGSLRPTKNLIYFYLSGSGSNVSGGMSSIDASGVQTDGDGINFGSGGSISGTTVRLELTSGGQVTLKKNGVTMTALTHTASLGTNLKMSVQMLSVLANGFSYDTAIDNVSFK